MNSSNPHDIPQGHKPVLNGNPENCPYLQINKKAEETLQTNTSKPKTSKKNDDESDLSDEETQGTQGSCPFMPSFKKRNPDLTHLEEGYDIEFISRMKDLLKNRGMYKKEDFNKKRVIFNKYPIYLQETLFFNDEQMKKLRKVEISQRFFLCDEWRERGNRHFHHENYKRAIYYYSLCLSAFKWLELGQIDKGMRYKPKVDSQKRKILEDFKKQAKEKEKEENKEEEEEEDEEEEEEEEENLNKNDDIFEETKEYLDYKEEEENKAFDEKYKLFLSVFTDENIKLFDEKDLEDEADVDLRKSFMINLYMNMSVCFMKMKHFSLAIKALQDAEDLDYNKTLMNNKCLAYSQLQEAQKQIEKALEIKKTERIFQQKKEYVKLLNVQNAQEIYEEHLIRVKEKLKKKLEDESKEIRSILIKVKDRYFVESILGKKNKSNINNNSTMVNIKNEDQDFQLIKIMNARYLRMIEFFQQTKKKEEEKKASKELEYVKAVLSKMRFYFDLDFKNNQNDILIKEAKKDINLDLSNPEVLKLLDSEKHKKMIEIFENAEFNLEILNYALRESLLKQEKIRKKNKGKGCCEFSNENSEKKLGSWNKLMNLHIFFKIILMILVITIVWAFYHNSKTIGLLNFKNKRKF